MKNFLLKCCLFFAVFFVADKALIPIRNSAPDRELDKRLEQVLLGKINADILITGSSRGARDILASNVAAALQTTAFNLSYPGSNIEFHSYLLQKLLQFKNHKPRLIILATDDPYELRDQVSQNFRFDRLYPLVKYADVRQTLVENNEKSGLLSSLFILHQLSLSSFNFKPKQFAPVDTLLADGSMPISFQKKGFNDPYNANPATYDERNETAEKIKEFNRFVSLCKDNNIRLLVVIPPNFSKPTPGFKERLGQLVTGPNASLLQFDSSNPVYANRDYFHDGGHLTQTGAAIFTTEITDCIKAHHLLQ